MKLSEVIKSSSYVSRISFCSLEKLKVQQTFRFLLLTARKSLRNVFGQVFKSVLVLSTVTIWGKLVFLKICFFFFLRNWVKFLCLLAKETERNCHKIILRVQKVNSLVRKTWKRTSVEFYRTWSERNCKNFPADLSEVYLSCPEQHFEEIYFSWRFFSSWDFDRKFCALWQMKLSEVFETSFYVSRRSVFSSESLERGQVFSFLVFTAKLLGNIVESVLVFSIATFWGKTVFFSKNFFLSGILSVSFMPYGKTNLARLLKIRFTRPEDLFFSYQTLKKAQIFRFIVLTAKKILEKLFGRLVKSVLVLSTVTLWGKLFFWRFFLRY